MEGLFEALLQFVLEFVLELVIELVFEIVGEFIRNILTQPLNLSTKNNLLSLFSLSDEIIKLNIFK